MPTSDVTLPYQAYKALREIAPHFKPKIGIVLGSGLSDFAQILTDKQVIDYQDLPGFPNINVYGHRGQLLLGYIAGVEVICLQGRAHYYEGPTAAQAIKTYIRTMKLMGCTYFLATNASGSLRQEVAPGSLMLITDHINMQPFNPLIGANDDEFGPRFFALDNAYDATMRHTFMQIAKARGITLHQGVYLAVHGPNYETAAEIRAFRMLGADAVGMSTVPEVLVANHCGMKVAVLATITNYATGLNQEAHDHHQVVATATKACGELTELITDFIKQLNLSENECYPHP
ncbi:MAG: purine-nucleoside phosphorylase [Legionellaceae bacterium]|nr:purine-nucleoside phosphorylase [Legionellaceae bacterium]HAF87705.1 purine-nucleoside phosphorylase [Legionellales bacterium]HCA88975.1 purine-nucleoside phosphorylase [Legionellales bacterium]|tara:strand:+ start:2693 stop:3556 length:864 start_codon:yes stop_codon:yes gene_type:complete